ncbi:hypothetical protein F3S47_09570 [Histidinibacterium aquaticum]|uniref:Uncharacterized protein n=1 Tax=Histidinibacterium aquaticum TaxID=2613962 RepID=A0A5J5GPH3_9RHOB|nr:hypothetical protein F3S47_09570 [Histidinibacterium aquaticum]
MRGHAVSGAHPAPRGGTGPAARSAPGLRRARDSGSGRSGRAWRACRKSRSAHRSVRRSPRSPSQAR